MREQTKEAQEPMNNTAELVRKFNDLNDLDAAHSVITRELFESGKSGEEKVAERINQIEDRFIKDNALFRIAKLYYESNNDIQSALRKVSEISDPNEQTRCLTHLAIAVITNEGNLDLAEKIVSRAEQDREGYLRYYEKEKQRYIDGQKK